MYTLNTIQSLVIQNIGPWFVGLYTACFVSGISVKYIHDKYFLTFHSLQHIWNKKEICDRNTHNVRMNECLTTPQHKKQIGYWVSEKGKPMNVRCIKYNIGEFETFQYLLFA